MSNLLNVQKAVLCIPFLLTMFCDKVMNIGWKIYFSTDRLVAFKWASHNSVNYVEFFRLLQYFCVVLHTRPVWAYEWYMALPAEMSHAICMSSPPIVMNEIELNFYQLCMKRNCNRCIINCILHSLGSILLVFHLLYLYSIIYLDSIYCNILTQSKSFRKTLSPMLVKCDNLSRYTSDSLADRNYVVGLICAACWIWCWPGEDFWECWKGDYYYQTLTSRRLH